MTKILRAWPALLLCALPASADPVINEIMFRPGTAYPENTALEFVEIYNPDDLVVDLSGWAFTKGIDFHFPEGTSIAAGGYLVIASNPAALATATGFSTALGPWQAGMNLSNSGEVIRLSKPEPDTGELTTADSVRYADEGDWANCNRNTLGGWSWITQANGGGCSLERRNPRLDADSGQNWGSSSAVGGSPGAVNSRVVANVAPVISGMLHSPAVPKSTDLVTISCRLADESAVSTLTATLFWRDASTQVPGAFQSIAMTNDGNGRFATTLPAKANKTIVEFYVQASDGILSRTWPAPTSEGQNANCIYQVDDEIDGAGAATYRLILTASENAAYETLAATNPQSDREFNMTFVASHGEESTIRYRSRMRIRGQSSRNFIFKPLRISFPTDDLWEDVSDFSLNPKYPWVQFLGMRAIQAAGLVAGDAIPVELRRNGAESVSGTGTNPDYGMWVRVEAINGAYADRHFPEAQSVQLYRKNAGLTEWSSNYTAPIHPDGIYSGWSKQNESGRNDWSDVANFSAVWQAVAAPYFPGATPGDLRTGTWNGAAFTDQEVATLSTVADLDEMARWLAVMTILNNTEHNISNGEDNDYGAAFVSDGVHRRFNLIPHDTDNMLGKGDSPKGATAVGLYAMTEVDAIFRPLLPLMGDSLRPGNPAFRQKYLTAIRELYGSVFDSDTSANPNPPFHVWLDNHLGNWVPATVRTQLKTYATARQNYLLGLIGAGKILPPSATSEAGFTHAPAGGLRINEVMADNTTAYPAGDGFPDLIELHNTSGSEIALSGLSIADSGNEYFFPDGSPSIPPGGFHVISSTTLGFNLSAKGDTVRLADELGATLDEVSFGPQIANLSISRTLGDDWALTTPSIGTANGSALNLGNPSGLRINEWAGNTNYRLSDDFIELYNPAAAPVALGGLRFTDNLASRPSRYAFPPLSFMAASGFLAVDSDILDFGLNGHFETVWLTGANGAVIDQVDLIAQHADTSTGRTPDGGTGWANFNVPSPGLSNATASTGYESIFANLRVSEIMYAPSGGDNFEFIELHNIGEMPLDISGVRFTDGIDYTFAPETILPAKAFIVVCRNRSSFLGRYPSASSRLATGNYSGSLANGGETLTLTLPSPWNLNVLKFKYSSGWYATNGNGRSLNTVDQGVTHPANWGNSEEWMPSSMLNGSPGAGEPPIITSALSSSGIIGDAFAYRITATRSPSGYGASGLPEGLSIDPASGLISGSPVVSGVFPVTISATNDAVTASATLTLSVTAHGDFHHFAWESVQGPHFSGIPFPVTVSARDAGGRLIPEYSGSVALSAATASGDVVRTPGQAPGSAPLVNLVSPILITELTDETEDQFELQNVTTAAVDTTGWFVVVGDSTSSITARNATTFNLPSSMGGQSLLRVSDTAGAGRVPFGSDIKWSHTNSKGWVMLFDANSMLRDFAAFGWTASNLSGLSITVNGKTISPVAQGHWSGAGFVAGVRGSAFDTSDSWKRVGTTDGHNATNWEWAQYAHSFGSTNIGLILPWIITTPLSISPGSLTITNGSFQGNITIADAASDVVLTVKDGSGHLGDSEPFDMLSPYGDTDGDGMPDLWEVTHGLSHTDSTDAFADADGDGQSNLAEHQAGTNPRLASSVFAASGVLDAATGTYTVAWPAVAGKTYQIHSSTGLSSWTLRGTVAAQESGPRNFPVVTDGNPNMYFKVVIVP